MKEILKKITQGIMIFVVAFNCIFVPVSAEEEADIVEEKTDINDIPEGIEIKHLSESDFLPISQLNPRMAARLKGFNKSLSRETAIANAGDQYEPNDSIAEATTEMQGKLIQATIHSETDVDYYQFEVTANEPISILLFNIPSGCDYDLYLFNHDQTEGYADFKDGSVSEEFYISLDKSGTYYVAVDSHSGCSNSPYSLYFGDFYVYGGTGWVDPDLSFSFGSVPRGTTRTSLVKNINLTYDSSIPDGAVVTKFYLSKEGTGGDYAEFYKYLKPDSGNTIKQLGGLQVMTVPSNTLVKQNWQIWGSVGYSNYFTWEPRYYILYEFYVTPLTTRYL